MLAKLDPALLDRLSFPLGGLVEGRGSARLPATPGRCADKRESQDSASWLGLGGRAFLQRHSLRPGRPGEIVDRDGHVLGRHEGQYNFTVGQRRD